MVFGPKDNKDLLPPNTRLNKKENALVFLYLGSGQNKIANIVIIYKYKCKKLTKFSMSK